VGKEVMFRVDYTVPSTGREYGAIFLNQENVAHMLVREGWADVREIRASDAENVDVEALYSYKAEAQAAKRGIWADSASVSSWMLRLELEWMSFGINRGDVQE
jgi:staphylococcal nuclease domain-containing protein 1